MICMLIICKIEKGSPNGKGYIPSNVILVFCMVSGLNLVAHGDGDAHSNLKGNS